MTVNVSNFNAVAQDSGLSIELGNVLVGVVADAEGNTGSVKMAEKTSLTDASYDPKSSKLYTKILGEDKQNNTIITGFEDLDNATVPDEEGIGSAVKSNPKWSYENGSGNDKTTAYYGVSWTWNFTYGFKSDANDIDLFFDIANSTFAIESKDNKNRNGTAYDPTTNKGVGKGFRLA